VESQYDHRHDSDPGIPGHAASPADGSRATRAGSDDGAVEPLRGSVTDAHSATSDRPETAH